MPNMPSHLYTIGNIKNVLYRFRKRRSFSGLNIELKEVLELKFDCIFTFFVVLRS